MQDRISAVRKSIHRAERSVRLGSNRANRDLRLKLRHLRDTERRLSEQAASLYTELDVPVDFPGIGRYGRDFVKRLIVLHDARRTVQRRVAGRLFEYERIDQATGGSGRHLGAPSSPHKHACLVNIFTGTKEHQSVLTAMTKRTPALQNAIRRHNELLAEMRSMLDDMNDTYPLPDELPAEVTKLKTTHADALLEDVVSFEPDQEPDVWMSDPKVRAGIRAVHVIDRCREERERLRWEEQNLLAYVRQRAVGVRTAIEECDSMSSVYVRRR